MNIRLRSVLMVPLMASAILLAGLGEAAAAPIAIEEFNYRDGVLAGNNGGSGFAGAWTGGGSVSGGVALTGGQAAFRQLSTATTPSAGQALYVSYDFGADSSQALDFAGISFFSGADERALFGMTFDTDHYGINVTGFANTDSGNAVVTAPRRLIGEVLFSGASSATFNLYLDSPANLVSSYAGSFLPGGAWDGIRIASGISPSTTASFDNIRIGTTFADVTAVPEPSTAVLLLGALLSLVAGRRRPGVHGLLGGTQLARASS